MTKWISKALHGSVALAFVLIGSDAFALGTPPEEHPYRSPQNAALEFRVGPYKPNIDDARDLAGDPYRKSFGTGPRIYTGLEIDWQVYRIPAIGTIGPGFQFGRAAATRDSRRAGRLVADYSLTTYPLFLDAVLRVDQLYVRFGVPFMPYAKAGLGVGVWNVSGAFRTALGPGTKSSGESYGENAAFGVAVPLDFLDRDSSRGADRSLGINTSSIFLEYDLLDLTGLGAAHTLRVGDRTWIAGALFEL